MAKDKEQKVGGAEEEKVKTIKTPGEDSLAGNVEKLLGLVETLNANQEALKSQIQAAQNENKDLKEQLEFIADKGRFSKWEQKQLASGVKEHVYKLQTFHGKLVVGWTSMKTNLIYKKENGAYVEDQTTTLIYEDQSQEDVRYDNWQAQRVAVKLTLEETKNLKDGTVLYVLRKEDGNLVTVDSKFVN